VGMADGARDRAVGGRLAVRDAAQATPDALLKLRAGKGERDVEVAQLAREVGAKLRDDAAQGAIVAAPRFRRVGRAPVVREANLRERALVVAGHEEIADRRF